MKKAMRIIFMVLCLTIGIMGNPTSAQAKAYMKDSHISFSIKPKKKFKFYNSFAGIGSKKETAQVTYYKVKKHPSKKGYKVATIKVKFFDDYKLSKKQVHKIIDVSGGYSFGDGFNTFIMDYNTGKAISSSYKSYDPSTYWDYNEYYSDYVYSGYDPDRDSWTDYNKNGKIKVVYSRWTYGARKTYRDNDGCWVGLCPAYRTIKVTYPSSCKSLCLGMGGSPKLYETTNDMKFDNGLLPFKKTSYYSKKLNYWRFMRIK